MPLHGGETVNQALIDTDILSLFFRKNEKVLTHFREYLKVYEQINFCIITYYEILSGLKHKDAGKQLDLFQEFVGYSMVLPLTEESVEISADLYANLRKRGQQLDDIDILIAGIAISNGMLLVTRNTKHFDRIDGLTTIDWSV
jgi:tRNA(fMet)-specific endonuclease VapC